MALPSEAQLAGWRLLRFLLKAVQDDHGRAFEPFLGRLDP